MTKAKKAELSIEEKLQAALVPENEQPYSVPENWCWIKLKSISKIKTGKKDANYGKNGGQYPFFTCASEPINCEGYSFDCKAIILAGNGDISNISLYQGRFEAYQRTYVVEINTFSVEFIYYFFKDNWFDYNKDKMFGTAIPYIRLGNLKEFHIPLSPLFEQHRIVHCIESLFAKLDEAKEKAQSALDSFETRKAAILHQAFTGELTAQWRKEHGVGMESWKEKSIGGLCTSLSYGTSSKSQKTGRVIVVRMGNLQQGEIVWDNLAYSNDDKDIEKYMLQSGDVLFNRTNSPELVGKTSIYRGEFPAIYAGYLIKLDYHKEEITGEYLNYYMNSQEAREYCNKVKSDGVNQSNINAKKIGNFEIRVPSMDEQREITTIIDKFFLSNIESQRMIESVLNQIDLLKKSILARAFRGELGTNNPTEENARELLKEVL